MQGEVDMMSYPFTPEMKKGPVETLFDTMAGKLVEFAQASVWNSSAKPVLSAPCRRPSRSWIDG